MFENGIFFFHHHLHLCLKAGEIFVFFFTNCRKEELFQPSNFKTDTILGSVWSLRYDRN